MRTLGIYGPKFPERSGVANYIDLTLTGLRQFFSCVHVSNQDWVDPSSFDYTLYHIGASINHDCSFKALRLRRGPIVIHEHLCLAYYYEAWPLLPSIEQEKLLELFSYAFKQAVQSISDVITYFEAYPTLDRYALDIGSELIYIKRATIAMTHSPYVKEILQYRYPQIPIEVIPFIVKPFNIEKSVEIRKQLGLRTSDFLFGIFGFIGEYKRVERIIEAWCACTDRPSWVKLLIVGERQYDVKIPQSPDILYVDYIDNDEVFDAYLGAADCAIQLRYPTLGETSGNVSKLLANGRRIIISDTPFTAHYALHDRIIRIRPDKNEIQNLVTTFKRILQLPRFQPEFDAAHSTDVYSRQLVRIIKSYSSGNNNKLRAGQMSI